MLSVFFWNVGNRKPDQTMVWTKCGLSSLVTVSGLGSLGLMCRLPGFRLLVQPSYHVAFILIFIVLVGSLAAPYSPSLLQAGGKSRVKVEVEMPVEPTPKKPNPASLLLARVSHSHSYFENTGVLFWSWMYFYPEPDQGSLVISGEWVLDRQLTVSSLLKFPRVCRLPDMTAFTRWGVLCPYLSCCCRDFISGVQGRLLLGMSWGFFRCSGINWVSSSFVFS